MYNKDGKDYIAQASTEYVAKTIVHQLRVFYGVTAAYRPIEDSERDALDAMGEGHNELVIEAETAKNSHIDFHRLGTVRGFAKGVGVGMAVQAIAAAKGDSK